MRYTRTFAMIPLAAVVVLGLAACGGDEEDPEPTGTATSTGTATAGGSPTSTSTATASPTAEPTEPSIAFETPATIFSKDEDGEVAILADVRAARNEGFDRVVIEFEGGDVPGYRVEYVDEIVQCGSGEAVEFAAPVLVSVTVRPAAGHREDGEATVPNQVPTQGTAAVQEIIGFCDFEAVVGYGIGLASARPYRVFELQDPPRLVIDFSQ